jgi:hypothetical protein
MFFFQTRGLKRERRRERSAIDQSARRRRLKPFFNCLNNSSYLSLKNTISHLEHRDVLVLGEDLVGHLDLFWSLFAYERREESEKTSEHSIVEREAAKL